MHWLDLVIMFAYVLLCMTVGILARGKDENAEDYFTAGGRLGGFFVTLVVGLSIAGTFFSGITFIAYPSIVYSEGILPLVGSFVSLGLSYLALRYWFLPRYLAGKWAFPYDVLEQRFGSATRTTAAALYVLMRIGWMALMIYAPTVAIMTMAHLDAKWFWPIVLITGLTNTFYTVVSGIRGVIVTEAIQMLVIAVGIAATIVVALWKLPVPFDVAWAHLHDTGRLDVLRFSLNPKVTMTMWSATIGMTVASLGNYIADQMALQRYLATASVRATSRAFAANLVGVIVVLLLLAGVGLSLFVFYSFANDPSVPASTDQIFPHFVATRLPSGVGGLVLAALLAATSIPSGINTLAGVLAIDFHARFKRDMTARQQLQWGRIYSLAIGLSATLAAGVVDRLGTVFDATQTILGIFIGPLFSCVVIAVAGWRCPGWAMVTGIFSGWLAGVAVASSGAAALWVPPVAATTTMVVARLLALVDRRPLAMLARDRSHANVGEVNALPSAIPTLSAGDD